MKHNCYNCAYSDEEVSTYNDCNNKPYEKIVKFTCMNPNCNIVCVNHPSTECVHFVPTDDKRIDDKSVLTITEKDYFRKSAQVLANMVLDSDHSYDYKRGFIDAFGEMTIALMSKDDEKE